MQRLGERRAEALVSTLAECLAFLALPALHEEELPAGCLSPDLHWRLLRSGHADPYPQRPSLGRAFRTASELFWCIDSPVLPN